jgi:DNA-directed RNA polymerase subunit RPC12/RpoP
MSGGKLCFIVDMDIDKRHPYSKDTATPVRLFEKLHNPTRSIHTSNYRADCPRCVYTLYLDDEDIYSGRYNYCPKCGQKIKFPLKGFRDGRLVEDEKCK